MITDLMLERSLSRMKPFPMPRGEDPFVAVGLDPTAGTSGPGGMRSGDKEMPSYAIGWDGTAFRPTSDPLSWNRSNDDFWGHVDRVGAGIVAIDGPCAVHPRPAETIETHPHGAFVFLWRFLGGEGLPPRKASPAGRRARWAILRAFIEQLPETPPASHDEIDALCAALVAGLHRLGLTVAFGKPAEGGEIWMPDVRKLVLAECDGRLPVVEG